MKLLIIGIDALMPNLVFDNFDLCPTLEKLCKSGISGDYSGYVYGHGSRDNWISMYTGLEPERHGTVNNLFADTNRLPRLYDYNTKGTVWDMLNANGHTVAMWKCLSTTPPKEIDGYFISGEPHHDKLDGDSEIVTDEPVVCEKDEDLLTVIEGKLPKSILPPTIESLGYTKEAILQNPDLIDEILTPDYFEASVKYFEEALDYKLKNVLNTNKKRPVDLLWVYDEIFDYIAHHQIFDDSNYVLKKTLPLIDRFVKELIEQIKPENVIVLSDHGQKSMKNFLPGADTALQKESFGMPGTIFSKKNMAVIGRSGGLFTGIHSQLGVIILNGKAFKQGTIEHFRNLDIFPLILETFNCVIPENRNGYVHDVFSENHVLTNKSKMYPYMKQRRKIALIQSEAVSDFNIAINEYFKNNRFDDITIIGEAKYKNIFLENEQVCSFIAFEDELMTVDYDEVFTVYRNKVTKTVKFISVSIKN